MATTRQKLPSVAKTPVPVLTGEREGSGEDPLVSGGDHLSLPPIRAGRTLGGGFKATAPRDRTGLSGPGIGLPTGAPVTRDNAHHIGLAEDEHRAFQGHAHGTGIDIGVRKGNPSRIPHIGAPGSRPKPEGLYSKTEKADPDTKGLVTAKPGGVIVKDDYRGMFDVASGETVVRDDAGNSIHGDIDLHGAYRGGRTVPAKEMVPALNKTLNARTRRPDVRTEGLQPKDLERPFGVTPSDKIQHGAHDEWHERNDMGYQGGLNAGPQPGVVVYGADRRARMLDTTADYRGYLKSIGREDVYSEEAWAKGAARDKEVNDKTATIKGIGPRPPKR